MTKRPLDRAVVAYKAVAHPVRLRILAMLRRGELCVCQLTAVLGLAASTVSAHLAELKHAGLASERKDGRWVRVRLAEGPETHGLLRDAWDRLGGDPEIGADARVLRQLSKVRPEVLCRAELDLARLGIVRSAIGR
jgi:arsenate reductase/ArsR family transcriptional regulator